MFFFPVPSRSVLVPIAIAKADPDSIDTPLGRIQGRQSRRIGRAIERGIKNLGLDVEQAALIDAIQRNDVDAILQLLNIEALAGAVEDGVESVVELAVRGADVGIKALPSAAAAMSTAPEIVSPFIVPFIESRGAELVRLVTDSQRKTIQDLIAEGFRTGRLLTETATDIMQTVGLFPRYALAVQRFRANLLEQGYSPARAARTAQGYANRLLRVRAMNIARTESLTALSAGQQESWEVAAREGFFDPDQSKREWTVFRPCPHICQPIPARGPVGLREPFITGQGIPVMHPPAHPSCRCVVNLIVAD